MDFYGNLNKGIENIIPLAMKKYELDSEEAKWRAQNDIQMQTLGIAKEKWAQEVEDQRKLKVLGDAVSGRMKTLADLKAQSEAAPAVVPGGGIEDQLPREQVLKQLVPKIAETEKSLNPERLSLELFAAHPEKGMPLIIEGMKEKNQAALLLEKLNNVLALGSMKGEHQAALMDAKWQMLLANIAGKKDLQAGKDAKDSQVKAADINALRSMSRFVEETGRESLDQPEDKRLSENELAMLNSARENAGLPPLMEQAHPGKKGMLWDDNDKYSYHPAEGVKGKKPTIPISAFDK